MSIDGAPVGAPVPREVFGAMSAIFNDGEGPTSQYIDSAMAAAGIDPSAHAGSKAVRVRTALTDSAPALAWKFLDELIHATRDRGFFNPRPLRRELVVLQGAIAMYGGHLTDEGHMAWTSGSGGVIGRAIVGQPPVATPRTTLTVSAPAPPPGPANAMDPSGTSPSATPVLPDPTHERLLAVLRRVPEAFRPMVRDRRPGQVDLSLLNEYDLQDAVEVALRLIFEDVRPEERTPSVAGSSSTPDFVLPTVTTAIEVKVTARGRGNRIVKEEIVLDSESYQAHPDVTRMVFVIYDLASTINNPRGFESDLTRTVDGYPREVLVVPWPYGVLSGR